MSQVRQRSFESTLRSRTVVSSRRSSRRIRALINRKPSDVPSQCSTASPHPHASKNFTRKTKRRKGNWSKNVRKIRKTRLTLSISSLLSINVAERSTSRSYYSIRSTQLLLVKVIVLVRGKWPKIRSSGIKTALSMLSVASPSWKIGERRSTTRELVICA